MKVEIYADTRGFGVCRGQSCHRRILWVQVVKTGKRLCFDDLELVALTTRHDSDGRLIEVVEGESHWSTCPDAKQFR